MIGHLLLIAVVGTTHGPAVPLRTAGMPPMSREAASGSVPPGALEEMAEQWLDDPVAFVRDVFGAEPDAWQIKALRSVADNPRTGMSACKGPGKSCVLAWAIWWYLYTRRDAHVVCTSVTRENLRDNLWAELTKWYAESEILQHAFGYGAERITHRERPGTWWCSARGWAQQADVTRQASALAGLHGKHVLVALDEMGSYPLAVLTTAEAIFANSEIDEARLVAAWNPERTDRAAYHVCTKARSQWCIINITADPDDPDRAPHVSIAWAQQAIDDWGRENDWVRINVLGLFPRQGAGMLISLDDVEQAQKRDAKPFVFASDAEVWGLDPGRSEFGDPSVLARRKGIMSWRFKEWRGLDGPQLAAQVATMLLKAEADGELPDAVIIDQGGVGSSALDHLKLLGWEELVIGVDFGGGALDPRYGNRRSEMWFNMEEWLRKKPSCLPTDPTLPSELTTVGYYSGTRGKRTVLYLRSKEQLRHDGIPSPNKGDSLALTFAEPVAPRSRAFRLAQQDSGVGRCVTQAEYQRQDVAGSGRCLSSYYPGREEA